MFDRISQYINHTNCVYLLFLPPNLAGSESAAEADAECVESVTKASTELPASFGGVWGGNELHPLDGCFKTRLLVVLLAALLSRRKVMQQT